MEQFPSDQDQTSWQTLKEVGDSIYSTPAQTSKPPTNKDHLYLINFHAAASDSYITRLPNNLLRLLISYNTVTELLSFTFTCKRFAQFLFDKYISFSGDCGTTGFFKQDKFTFQEHFDLIRKMELSARGYRVKIHASLQAEFTSVFHVNTKKETFYSYKNEEIVEGVLVRYNDTFEITRTRPCISHAVVWDVSGEVIICASSIELALSLPSQPLRVARFEREETPGSLRLLGEKRLILVQKPGKFETWSELLQPLGVISHEGGISSLQIADVKRMVFATQSVAGFVTAYQGDLRGNLKKMWQWTSSFGQSRVKSCHLASIKGHFVLIILTITGSLYANSAEITKPNEVWTHFSVLNDKLFAGSDNNLFIFAFNSPSGQYKSISKLRVRCDPWSSLFTYVYYSRMKGIAVFETEFGHKVIYFSPNSHAISVFCTVNLPKIAGIAVQVYKEVMVITGSLIVEREGEKWPIPCVYVLNFNLNSMLSREPDLMQQAMRVVEEKAAEIAKLRLKRVEMKRKEKSEKAKKAEEREKKHRPKH